MKLSRKFIAVALLFVALVLVNYLAATLPVRIDATADQIYTLSPGTRAILARIEEPVTLNFYWSKSASSPVVAYKDFAARVEEMLRQYVRAAHGKLILNVINPLPDTPEEEQAAAAGIQPQTWPGSGEKVYFGLVAIQADQQKNIPAFDPEREPFLEYDLSQLIYSVQQFDKKKLGLITSLPLEGAPENPMLQQQPSERQFVIDEWEKTFDIVPVQQTAAGLPANLDALAVIHPENLPPKLQFAIDQFLLAGKPVFLALDPSSEYFKRRAGQMAMFGGPMPNVSSDLPVLLKAYGIDYNSQNVVGDLENAAQVQTGDGSTARYPVWLLLGADSFNAKSLPTAQLKSIALIEPGSFSVKPNPALTVTPLIESSTQSGDVPAFALQMAQPDDILRQVKPTGQKKLLAALITGKFKTAFPDGAPADEKAGAKKDAAPALKESKGASTLIFIADTDWMLDSFSVRRFDFLGVPAAQPLNDNLAFAANSLDFLAGSQDLISIRGKGSSLRPFTVVHEMEVKAQNKYQQQLDALEARLGEVQQKLSALQNQNGGSKNLITSPEVQKSIDDFQKQEVDMQRQRRQIRLALRQGIDALGNRLLLANLFAAPLLVCAFGVWFYRARRH
ncbi:MAG TPA: Gldg family protein [Opitutaceae bacterium]|nr:Gldg family protein [Opitutaceae bacterium]